MHISTSIITLEDCISKKKNAKFPPLINYQLMCTIPEGSKSMFVMFGIISPPATTPTPMIMDE